MRACPGEAEGEVEEYYQGNSLSGLARVWDPGWDLAWVEETYRFQKGTGLLIQHIPAGEDEPGYARFVGEFRGTWGREFSLEYHYRKGTEPADSTILVHGDYEYWPTEDGVTVGIHWENTTWGRKRFWASWSGPEVRFDLGGSGLSRDEIHQILNSLHLSSLSRQKA